MNAFSDHPRPIGANAILEGHILKVTSTDLAVRLFIVSGHAIVRHALVERFTGADGFEVIGDVSRVEDMPAAAPETSPHVVILSLAAASIDCESVGRFLKLRGHASRLVLLTGCDHNALILQTVIPYATGIVGAADPPELLAHAVREAASHRTFVSGTLRDRLLVDDRGIRLAPSFQSPLAKLTKRELEILRYVATGSSQRSIAMAEHISVKTVDSHCTNLMRKLDIHDRVTLTRFAIREGLVRA